MCERLFYLQKMKLNSFMFLHSKVEFGCLADFPEVHIEPVNGVTRRNGKQLMAKTFCSQCRHLALTIS